MLWAMANISNTPTYHLAITRPWMHHSTVWHHSGSHVHTAHRRHRNVHEILKPKHQIFSGELGAAKKQERGGGGLLFFPIFITYGMWLLKTNEVCFMWSCFCAYLTLSLSSLRHKLCISWISNYCLPTDDIITAYAAHLSCPVEGHVQDKSSTCIKMTPTDQSDCLILSLSEWILKEAERGC